MADPLQLTLSKLSADPEFAKLGWEDQVEVRSNITEKVLARDPQYQQLQPVDKADVLRKLAFGPQPTFENPEIQLKMERTLQRLNAYKEPVGLGKKRLQDELDDEMGQLAAIGESVQNIVYGMTREMPVTVGLPNTILKFVPKLAYEVNKRLFGETSEPAQNMKRLMAENASYSRDLDKWASYTDYYMDSRKQLAALTHKRNKTLLSMGGGMADFMAAFLAGGAAFGGAAKVVTTAETVSKVAKGFQVAGTFAARRLGEASFGVAHEYLKDFMNDNSANPKVEVTLNRTLAMFGGELTVDLLLMGLGRASISILKGLKHVVKPGGFKVPPLAKNEAFDRAFRATMELDDFNLAEFSNLPEFAQRNLVSLQSAMKTANNVKPKSPINVLEPLVMREGYSITKDVVEGSYLLKGLEEGLPDKAFKNFDQLEGWAADKIVARIKRTGLDHAASVAAAKNIQVDFNPGWVEYAAEMKYGTQPVQTPNGWEITPLDQGTLQFANLADLGDFILKDKMVGDKFDAVLGPKLALVDATNWHTSYTKEGLVSGNYQDVLRELDKFKSSKTANMVTHIQRPDGGKITTTTGNIFEVYVPQLGHRKGFTDLNAAREYLEGGWQEMTAIKDAANYKGYRLYPYSGKWALYSDSGQVFYADTKKEVIGILKDAPIPEWAPEISGIDARLAQSFSIAPDLTDPNYDELFPTRMGDSDGDIGGFLKQHWWRPTDAIVERGVRNLGVPEEFLDRVHRIDYVQDVARGEFAKIDRSLREIYRLPNGKSVAGNRKVLGKLNAVFEAPDRAAASRVLDEVGLPPEYMSLYDRYRGWTGPSEETGMAGYLKIGQKPTEGPFEQSYITRVIRNHLRTNPNKWYGDVDTLELMRQAGVQERHLPFFRHVRKADVVSLALLEDPLEASRRMLRLATNEKYINPELDDMVKWFNKEAKSGNVNGGFIQYYADFMEAAGALRGVRGETSEEVSRAVKGLLKKTPFFNKREIDSVTQLLVDSSYSAYLGVRPWTYIRNILIQPHLTLAPRVGNSYVTMAKNALASGDPKIYEMARNAGVLLDVLPVGGGKKSTIGNWTLQRFRRSDDYTRVLSWLSTKFRFDEAANLARKGAFKGDFKKFLARSGVNALDDSVQRQVVRQISAGNWAAAQDLYSRQITQEVMFPYRRSMNPKFQRGGLISRLFGQMGTYAGWWTENIFRGFRRGDTASKVGYLARLVSNSAILMGTAAALGVKANVFSPWSPAGFTGGPYWDFGTTAIQANPFSTTYASRQARAEMYGIGYTKGKLSWSLDKFSKSKLVNYMLPLPGKLQAQYIARGIRYLNEGDAHRAILAFLSIPENPKYFEE